jgi:glutamyl/glutaminyl-tRNA synthetase
VTIPPPPPTRRDDLVETLHGTEVADPFRWLEDGFDPVRRARLESDTPYALRLDMRKAIARVSPLSWNELGQGRIYVDISLVGDVVVARKETATSYHLTVAVDDNIQDITLVTRGRDLFHATHVHRMLQALLGYRAPDYLHHEVLVDAEGKRFAKRDHAVTIQALREAGHTAANVIAMAEQLARDGALPRARGRAALDHARTHDPLRVLVRAGRRRRLG